MNTFFNLIVASILCLATASSYAQDSQDQTNQAEQRTNILSLLTPDFKKIKSLFEYISTSSGKAMSELQKLRIVIHSSTTCGYCQRLEQHLIETNQTSHFRATVFGRSLEIPISIDLSEEDPRLKAFPSAEILWGDKSESLAFGVFGSNIEEFKKNVNLILSKFTEGIISNMTQPIYKNKSKNNSIALIWGTNGPYLELSTYNLIRLIQNNLFLMGLSPKSLFSFYGTQNKEETNDVWVSGPEMAPLGMIAQDQTRLTYFDSKIFEAVAANSKDIPKRLWVIAGHGVKNNLIGYEEKIPLDTIKNALQTDYKGTNVIVSGACFSGSLYTVPHCGFFAANPDSYASGCYATDDDVSPLYLALFFNSIKDFKADFNKDGKVTFNEAHTYAMLNGIELDQPFSSFDGYANDLFSTTNPQNIESMTSTEIKKLVSQHGSAEDLLLIEDMKMGWLWDSSYPILGYDKISLVVKRSLLKKYMSQKRWGKGKNNLIDKLQKVLDCENQDARDFLLN